jgi:hypothetical protein
MIVRFSILGQDKSWEAQISVYSRNFQARVSENPFASPHHHQTLVFSGQGLEMPRDVFLPEDSISPGCRYKLKIDNKLFEISAKDIQRHNHTKDYHAWQPLKSVLHLSMK